MTGTTTMKARNFLTGLCAGLALVLALLAGVLLEAAVGEVFSDDFSRGDGPLDDPWQTMSSSLSIGAQRVVGAAQTTSNMYRLSRMTSDDTSVEFDLCFNGDGDDGRFHVYIGGGVDEQSAWGYTGRVTTSSLILRRYFPEEDLDEVAFAPDLGAVYRVRLEYVSALGRVQLTLEDDLGAPVAQADALVTPAERFNQCAIGIENLAASAKWLDDVWFSSDGGPSSDAAAWFEIAGTGYRDGHLGYYTEYREDGVFQASSFLAADGDHLRMIAYTESEGGAFIPYPPDCFWAKTASLSIGETWQSHIDGLATAEVVGTETVVTSAGAFDTYRVEYRRQTTQTLLFVAWFAYDAGMVRMGGSETSYHDYHAIQIVDGSGYLPLEVGNWWSTDVTAGAAPPVSLAACRLRCHPNPFNPRTTISFDLPRETRVTLGVYDVAGRLVAPLLRNETAPPGRNEVVWRGTDAYGRPVPSGTYLCHLAAGGRAETRRMLLVK